MRIFFPTERKALISFWFSSEFTLTKVRQRKYSKPEENTTVYI